MKRMPYELIPMAGAAASAVVFAVWANRTGVSARDSLGASLIFFAALTLTGSMILHSGEILYNQIIGADPGIYTRQPGAPHANLWGFTYDFRFYSLQLFGGALIWMGSRLAWCSIGMVRGSLAARRRAWESVIFVVLFVLPLVPMHIFAVGTTAVMAIACAGLGVMRRTASEGGDAFAPHRMKSTRPLQEAV